jgi:hypothetical protein
MAPEQARGEPVDHRADIWSSGLVLYKMVRGLRPVPAVRLRVDESPELERIIAKCLETDRTLRYQHAADLRTDLERLTRGSDPALTGREQQAAKARARWTVVAAAAGSRWRGLRCGRHRTREQSLGPAVGLTEQHDDEQVDPLDRVARQTDATLRILVIG